jgi:hypothetical protein
MCTDQHNRRNDHQQLRINEQNQNPLQVNNNLTFLFSNLPLIDQNQSNTNIRHPVHPPKIQIPRQRHQKLDFFFFIVTSFHHS